MDEYNSGMDPELKRYFRKIINSFTLGLLWMLCMATLGIFFGLGVVVHGVKWYTVVFYVFAVGSFGGLMWYYVRVWREKSKVKS